LTSLKNVTPLLRIHVNVIVIVREHGFRLISLIEDVITGLDVFEEVPSEYLVSYPAGFGVHHECEFVTVVEPSAYGTLRWGCSTLLENSEYCQCHHCGRRPVAVSTLLLRFFRMHLPPALAVGLLPFVMTAPNGWYPISVALGTSTVVVFFLGRGWLMKALTYTRQRVGDFNV
jgi:hypothetical protein